MNDQTHKNNRDAIYEKHLTSRRQTKTQLLTIRIDVDYPYPSRLRSFIYTTLCLRAGKDYLKNPKIVARMVNGSTVSVKAHWFFTVKTAPDDELQELIDNDRHEIALHVVNDPYKELKQLEDSTGKKINYYTIHGTARIIARIMWKRWKVRAPIIPYDFPLRSFHELPTIGLDSLCYSHTMEQALRISEERIREGYVIYFHPIWLFQKGKLNHRGPFYEVLRRILADG